MLIHPVTIGNVQIQNNLFLAPMAGVTDRSFRALCREHGCTLTYSEMVSAKSIVYDNANTKQLLDTSESEQPWAVQLFGSEPDVMAEAVRRLEDRPFQIVDINMGCPVPKIVRNGEGCALMKNPALAGRIIEKVSRASARPVTVKIRKGFSGTEANAVMVAHAAQESGAAAIAVHGRTRDQFYSGQADLDIIARVKQAVRIPVIGNGDIISPQAAAHMLTQTGCDAVMAARGVMGNPWLFRQMQSYLQTGEMTPPPGWPEKRETALRHAQMLIAHKGERIGVLEMRKHLSWYIKGVPDAAQMRTRINKASSYLEFETILWQLGSNGVDSEG